MKPPKRKETFIMRKYGFWNLVADVVLTLLTGGFWLIWIFVREMRNKR